MSGFFKIINLVSIVALNIAKCRHGILVLYFEQE